MRTLCGLRSQTENIGVTEADLVVIQTNGDIEATDALKSVYEGAATLGFNILENTFDQVAFDYHSRSNQAGLGCLPTPCTVCELKEVCGGGYLPHRYAKDTGYDNPSIYCSDLYKLINHIRMRVESDYKTLMVS